MEKKREDYISWDEYFMGLANLSSKRSKDPSTQVGCCIVDSSNRIVSVGYNGLPRNCSDDDFPWDREGDMLNTKYAYVAHAELNAILNNPGGSLEGTRLYVTLFPCNNCMKAIIQAGISEVIYSCDKYAEEDFTIAAKKLAESAGIKCTYMPPKGKEIILNI